MFGQSEKAREYYRRVIANTFAGLDAPCRQPARNRPVRLGRCTSGKSGNLFGDAIAWLRNLYLHLPILPTYLLPTYLATIDRIRAMTHAAKTKATLTPFKPILLQGKWRVGFTTTRDLHVWEELTWDYGCPPGGIEWLKRRPSKSGEHCACVKVLMNCTIPNTLLTLLCQQVLHPL